MPKVPFAITNQNQRALDGRVGVVVTYSTDITLDDSLYGNYILCDEGVSVVTGTVAEGFTCTLHNRGSSVVTLPTGDDLDPDASASLQYAQGWRLVGGVSGGGPAPAPGDQPVIQLRNLNDSQDINVSSWTEVPLAGIIDIDNSDEFDIVEGRVVCQFSGAVEVYTSVSQDSGVQRPNVFVQIAINGSRVGGVGMSGYIRSRSGHGESSSTITTVAEVAEGDEISVYSIQGANTGGVFQRKGESVLRVTRLTGARGPEGPPGPQGPEGPIGQAVNIQGTVPTETDLPVGYSGASGDLYIAVDTGDGHLWDSSQWTNVGPIQGPKGDPGIAEVDFGKVLISAPGLVTVTGLDFAPSKIEFQAEAGIDSYNKNSAGDNGGNNDNYQGSATGYAKLTSGGGIEQFTQHSGGSGASINHVSYYSSDTACIGLRYGDVNGRQIGFFAATLDSFNSDGFTLNATNYDLPNLAGQVITWKAYT